MTPTERTIRTRPKLLALCREVANNRFLALSDVCGRSRSKGATAGRHEVWWHLKRMEWSSPEIAALWGVDQSTVSYALKKWEEEA